MDTSALIDAIVEASAGTKYVMAKQLNVAEGKQEKVAGIKKWLDALVDNIKTMIPLRSSRLHSSVSDETKLGATADSDVVPGTYSISVSALAQSESEVSNGFADKDTSTVISTGSYQITYG